MDSIDFRPANNGDFEFFFRLHKNTLGPYVDRVWGWDDADQRSYLERTLDVDVTQVIVVNGVDIGRLNVDHHDDHLYVGLIEIAPDHQGRGIGGRILQRIRDDAFAQHKSVRLRVLEVNAGARRLYHRLGFVEVARTGTAPQIRIQMQARDSSLASHPSEVE
ncbi:GNAT family N-acetyltransferase [Mycobacterium hackensackense]|uniref:GNAT family N-acetyltransferase n=1 Tax=Mycobacterium hackensackense TaxID=228909 RepID=UPI002265A36F|nr:GNAT family N-acetyltransferase [Mycobacterium hackensackense]MCV7254629.1 GNAT family N-acetyltransferase [Mycobacterium hackensackense]